MRKRVLLFFAVCLAVIAGPAFAVPVWRTDPPGQPPTTYQKWTFDDSESVNVVPEIVSNAYGTPTADIAATGDVWGTAGWYASWLGRQGVWHGDITTITMRIPDTPLPNAYKELWVEVGFRGFLMEYSILDPPSGVTDLGYTIVEGGDGWKTLVFGFRIVPNPPLEVIYLALHNSGADLDYVTVDTICTPEPTTVALLGLGFAGLLGRKRA